jgi:hypothetical protein
LLAVGSCAWFAVGDTVVLSEELMLRRAVVLNAHFFNLPVRICDIHQIKLIDTEFTFIVKSTAKCAIFCFLVAREFFVIVWAGDLNVGMKALNSDVLIMIHY